MIRKPLTIVLAEDDDGHATLVCRSLARAGVQNEVIRVADGQEAIDLLHGRGPVGGRPSLDELLLLLDINMPRLNGLEVLRQLKADTATASIPVIMLTTTDDPRDVEQCYRLGCCVYVVKPVIYADFVEAVRRLGLFTQILTLPGTA